MLRVIMSCTTAVHDFLRAAMSSSRTLCCLLMRIFLHVWSTSLTVVTFRSASADNPYLDLDYSVYHKTSSNYGIISIRLKVFLPP